MMLEELSTPRALPMSGWWVRRLTHRGRSDCAVRTAPCWLAWAGPFEFTSGLSQRAGAVGHSVAQHCAPIFILFIFVGISRNCYNLLKSLENGIQLQKMQNQFWMNPQELNCTKNLTLPYFAQ
jgi:hypothetical protein